jgi:lysophospholipase L1-like esterase
MLHADTEVRQNEMRARAAHHFPRYFAILGYAVFILLAAVIPLELISWAVYSFYPEMPNQSRSESPVYTGVSWAREFWQEEKLRTRAGQTYVPFRIWGVQRWHGKYINNDEGEMGILRKTVNPVCETPPTSFWVFGGSTVYGTGTPDWATMPTYLSRDLNRAGRGCVVVWNFGVEGYVSNQELIFLTEQLKAGRHPDVVVIYDGVNDASAAEPAPGPPEPHFDYGTIKARIEGSVPARLDFLKRSHAVRLARVIAASLRKKRPTPISTETLHAKATATLDNYEANLRVARALSKAYNFNLYCFWQPSLYYGHKPRVPFEEELPDVSPADAGQNPWSLVIADVYQEAENRAARNGEFVFIGGLFDSVQEPLYIDQAHLGPRGNELVAHAIASYVEDHPEP